MRVNPEYGVLDGCLLPDEEEALSLLSLVL